MTRRGFTLIELLVVVAIIIILAAILLPLFANRTEEARVARMAAEIRALRTAVLMYMVDMNRLPAQFSDLLAPSSTPPEWRGPYIEKPYNSSPWGTTVTLNINSTTAADCLDVPSTISDFVYLEVAKTGIPDDSIIKLDNELDDGDTSKGYICDDSTNIEIFLQGRL